jgi:uncharacterized membrane protein YdbT with pleckstrin-like domain
MKMTPENYVYQARLHWILFMWPVVFLCFDIYLLVNFESVRQPSLLMGVLVLAWLVMTWSIYYCSSLTIKEKQLILRKGILVRQILDLPLSKIESIDIRQSIMGTLLGYGTLEITGVGGSREIINYLAKPLTCRRYIEQMMHS